MGIIVLGVILVALSFVIGAVEVPGAQKGATKGLALAARVVGVLMVVGGALSGGFVVVQSGYRAVLLRFGAMQGTLAEGIHFVMPGVNTIVLLEVRTQKEESTASAASRDLQTVTTTLALNFRIDPQQAGRLFQQVGTEYKVRIIDPTVQESIKVVTAKYSAEDLIRNRAQVKNEVERDIALRLKAYDIIVDPGGLSITNFEFSPEFNKAIEAKQIAQQEAEKQKFVLQQAELQKQTAIAKAQGDAESAKLKAAALQANGGALVIAREWIDKWDGKLPSVSAGGGGGGGGSFILDLSTLMRERAN